MSDAIIGDLASGLIRKLVSLATEEIILAWNLLDDLVRLRQRMESIDALLLDAATKKLTMSAVQTWFNQIEAVAHVADVFMDELAYQVTRHKVQHHRVWDFLIPSKKSSLLYRFKVAHKMKSINTSFDNIFTSAGELGLQPVAHLLATMQTRLIRKTPHSEDKSLLVGRDDDISYLVQMVCKNHEVELPVTAVYGMGGQGKTTVARMVYNRDAVINMFPKRMWITVSEDFDFMKILNQMVVSLTSTASVLENTEGLIKELQKNLKGEKFLLVLDDVWNEKPEEWDNLRNSLLEIGGARGSNILITTRSQEVAYAMRCSVSYQVKILSEEDSYELFKRIAFSHGGIVETEAFEELGRRLVKRCGGLPLAIKTLGGLLHSKESEQEWLEIQNSEIWKSKGVLASLRLSYDNLPYSSLKRCFAYCSIIPKDTDICKDELAQIWKALGFLLPARGSTALMEDIGYEYFNILLCNSLLQDVEKDAVGNITSCKMHDLVHDLALDLSKYHSVTVKTGHELNIVSHISQPIYLRLDERISNRNPAILKRNLERVQALYTGARFLGDMLPYLKHLTVLVLNANEITSELPSSLSKMKYLKYLDISCFRGILPSYITDLYNLETLRVWALQVLPKEFCNLINLRHLYIVNPHERCMFIGIENLTCLQTLPHFVVSPDHSCLVKNLGGLNNLRGKLDLYGLDNVEDMVEATQAKLCLKPNLQSLVLEWDTNTSLRVDEEYNDEEVMRGLKPHTNLKELKIEYFKGKQLASWIAMMTNLVKITLRYCSRCEGLPTLGHLPKLREMEINRMKNVKFIGDNSSGGRGSGGTEFTASWGTKTNTTMYPSLTKLRFFDLPELEEWLESVMSTCDEDRSTMLAFPKLEVLEINGCPKLTRIPGSCFPSLKLLFIVDSDSSSMILETISRNVSSLAYLRLENISNGGGGSSSSSSSSKMDSIIDQLLENNFKSLETLKLYDCKGLTSLKLGPAIKELEVSYCHDLTSINLVEDSSVLNYVTIWGCPSLSNWISG
ncbi:hypothetical protein DCAR_0206511 [Daucus carota subsp. sativus]|uniref:NB-ARC domain-containing protein n=1 Tax=Daucus carota subsp. sativus TaxID=79200 RepID=A0A166D933_DAUCS|nr:PREDICTED: putative disease resistance protein RGA4 [Daucus carota subsp. sativus]WOG87288.1 hypothetical protein DCAR_0206511 [Daucus carota subsp. sativus]